ncbi:hypothetical protein AB4343_05215 [Vibrio breoganii]|uniref:DUF481 domain-containing protein n=1 Tax=Vibrio breoganii TaxID=553239 RepID=A0AAP8MX18_9VIBR|nr:hypothetical protein [Vibrio breoganii]PMP10083.1 hypothetical protein BCS93_02845 [Vibrio breoganii]
MKNLTCHSLLAMPFALAFSSYAFASDPDSSGSNWQHSIEIYALALNIRGDSKINNLSADVDVDPKFIMDKIDMGAMGHWESVYKNTWGFYIDYSFMKLSGKTDSLLQQDLNVVSGSMDIRQGVLEAKVFKRYQYDFGFVDYMAGIRWWDNDIDTRVRSQNGLIDDESNLEEDWVDYLIGARLTTPLTESWSVYFNGDIGLSGDTNFTSSIQTGVRYAINGWSDLNLAYKSTWVDYDNGDTFAYDTASQGFLLGWAAHF